MSQKLRRVENESLRHHQDDVGLANYLQLALVKLYHPEVHNRDQFDRVAPETLARYADYVRKILVWDRVSHPHNRLIDIWASHRGINDPKGVLRFVQGLLNRFHATDEEVLKVIEDREDEKQLHLPF